MATLCLAVSHRVKEEEVANCGSANKKDEEETKPAVLTSMRGLICERESFAVNRKRPAKVLLLFRQAI